VPFGGHSEGVPSVSFHIRCIGEAMIELVVDPADDTAARLGVAGDVLNTAIYLRRALPDGFEVSFVSAVGTDAMSGRIVDFARSHGVACDRVARNPAKSAGLYAIEVDDSGERSFVYWRSDSAARAMFGPADSPDFTRLDGADVVLFSAITLAILDPEVRARFLDKVAALRARGTIVAFDSNYRPRLWESVAAARAAVTRAWGLTDIGFPSIDDEMALFDETQAEVIARLGANAMKTCVLKRGAQGPVLIHPAALAGRGVDAAPVRAVDTTGAGDSFNGAFLGSYLGDGDPVRAAERAHALASAVVQVRGAITPLSPT
jgi:2-dehydro-3-deoxygluconokinase